jgi:hypothetical protein
MNPHQEIAARGVKALQFSIASGERITVGVHPVNWLVLPLVSNGV